MFDHGLGDELTMRMVEMRHEQAFYELIDRNREHFGSPGTAG